MAPILQSENTIYSPPFMGGVKGVGLFMLMKRVFCLLLVLCTSCPLIWSKGYQAQRLVGEVFNTSYHIIYEGNGEDWHDSIRVLFREFDGSLSMFNDTSILSRMNRNDQTVRANAYVQTVVRKAQEISANTNGAFDITVAPLVNLWGFGFKNSDKVTAEAVDSIRKFVGYRKICLDADGRLSKADSRTQLDASSIAKGYMCDVIGTWLKGKGVTNYMVEIGGEVSLLGTNPEGKEWGVGINVPEEDALQRVNGIMNVIHLSSGGVATSGNYRNFYYRDGKRYAHTIDPRTGYPVQQDILSSTVIAPDCLTADAYATAFMVMGYKKAMEVLAKNPTITAYFVLDEAHTDPPPCPSHKRRGVVTTIPAKKCIVINDN